MKAEIIKKRGTVAKREILADKIPLDTPYLIQFFPAYACNFKCNYCVHSVKSDERGYISNEKFMDFDLFKKCVDELAEFPQKIKMIRFGGIGEPLLHPQIAEMLKYLSDKKACNVIEIITNASLLTPELTDKLVNSDISWLRISIQGLNNEKYKETSSVNLDFYKLVENLEYFYRKKKDSTKVYIKIIDTLLDEGEEEKFYDIFGNICDKIAIEFLTEASKNIDYSKISNRKLNITQCGNEFKEDLKVCNTTFFTLQVNPDGNIIPCCTMKPPCSMGNIKNQKITEIWNGKKYKNFHIMQLKKEKSKNKICEECQAYKYSLFPEDILDNRAEEILLRYT